jgi:hypothetical protein
MDVELQGFEGWHQIILEVKYNDRLHLEEIVSLHSASQLYAGYDTIGS